MDKIKQFDRVLLKDGRKASVVEIYGDQEIFDVDTGETTKDWDWDTVKREDIEKVIHE